MTVIDLYKQVKAENMSIQHVIELLKIANNDNPSIEYRCRELDAHDIFLSTFAFSFMKDDRGI